MRIAVASGKGGTGKTTLAVNLADLLARSRPTALIDLDVEEPNSGLFVQGDPVHAELCNKQVPAWRPGDCTFCGRCQEVCNFHAVMTLEDRVMVFPELCHACFACSELCPTASLPMTPRPVGELSHRRAGALDFIEGRLMVGEEQAVPLIHHTLRYADATLPEGTLQILDSPPGTSCPVVETVRAADLVVLVTEPTPFGLHDLKLAVETVRLLGRGCVVVLNRGGMGDDRTERWCAAEGVEIVARIPNDRTIAEHYAAGRLLHERVPSVRGAVEAVAERIAATPERRVS